MRAQFSSSKVSGELDAGGSYQVRIGAGYPAAARQSWYPGLFSFQPAARGPALVVFVEPRVVVDEESIFSAK